VSFLFTLRKKVLESKIPQSRVISFIIKALPARIKYGTSYVRATRTISLVEKGNFDVRRFQNQKLGELATNFNNSKYGARKKIGKSLDTFLTIQPMKSSDLPKDPEDLTSIPVSQLEICSTSGSSGAPKVFLLEKTRGPVETAFVHRAWKSAGFSHRDSRAVIRGIDNDSSEGKSFSWSPLLQELQISPFMMTENNLEAIWVEVVRRKIKFIHGYPSAIEVLAKWLERTRVSLEQTRTINGLLLISEELLEGQAELFNKVFPNAKCVSFYGQSEKVAFATQDAEDSSLFHFSPIYGITELLDDEGNQVSDVGAQGNLYSTGLLFSGTAFVRYELGDKAELVSKPTKDNDFVLTVRNIKSRWAASPIVGRSGEILSLASINMHSSELLDFSRIQFIQNRVGELTVLLVPSSSDYVNSLKVFSEKFASKLGTSLEINFQVVHEIQLNSRGKAKLFISKIKEQH
jgi:phenylacetate-CoA ligase